MEGSPMDPKVEEYINKQGSPQKEICLRLREIIIDTFPDIKEEMKWGVPTYGIERDGETYTKYYLGSLRDKVNLGFCIKGVPPEKLNLFEGKGKEMRHIKVFKLADIDKERIVGLLNMIPDH